MPKISVIISTYNSPEWLEKVLWGYECQSYDQFEIVIADDGSGDETRELIEGFAKQSTVPVKHVWQEDNGFQKCAILNKAILETRGKYLVFTDGDCIPHQHFLRTHAEFAKRGQFLSGGYCKLPMGTSEQVNRDAIQTGNVFTLRWLFAHGFGLKQKWLKVAGISWGLNRFLDSISPAKKTFNGNNSSCFRSDALAVGGFDERLGYGGEDREFGYRLENSGIKPFVIRYSALCLHLDHARGYVDQDIRRRNDEIIAETRNNSVVHTEYGIAS